jgi:hypothetical protein
MLESPGVSYQPVHDGSVSKADSGCEWSHCGLLVRPCVLIELFASVDIFAFNGLPRCNIFDPWCRAMTVSMSWCRRDKVDLWRHHYPA